jgi:hypothetical protein
MAWFRCFICGENFPGQLIGETQLVGFYVTRFVEATDAAGAEAAALQALRAEPQLAPAPGLHTVGASAGLLRGDRGGGRAGAAGSAGLRLVPNGRCGRRTGCAIGPLINALLADRGAHTADGSGSNGVRHRHREMVPVTGTARGLTPTERRET